jgi:hypothetical protein
VGLGLRAPAGPPARSEFASALWAIVGTRPDRHYRPLALACGSRCVAKGA